MKGSLVVWSVGLRGPSGCCPPIPAFIQFGGRQEKSRVTATFSCALIVITAERGHPRRGAASGLVRVGPAQSSTGSMPSSFIISPQTQVNSLC